MNTDYRSMLRSLLVHRQNLNPNYSLRAFARDIEVSPSHLSLILSNKKGLSPGLSHKISKNLNLGPFESEYFCNLVTAESTKSKPIKDAALERIKFLENNKVSPIKLSSSEFDFISDPIYYTFLCLMDTVDFKFDKPWLCEKLDINLAVLDTVISNLISVKLIKIQNGKIEKLHDHITTTNGVPSIAIKKFNHLLLKKAMNSIYEQDVSDRNLTSMTVSLNKQDYLEVVKMLKNLRSKVRVLSELSKNTKEDVYHLSLQLFKATKEIEKEEFEL